MKKTHVVFALAFSSLSFAATAQQTATTNAETHAPANASDVADSLVAWSAGYCKAMTEKNGTDFTSCFRNTTDIAIKRIEQAQADKAATKN